MRRIATTPNICYLYCTIEIFTQLPAEKRERSSASVVEALYFHSANLSRFQLAPTYGTWVTYGRRAFAVAAPATWNSLWNDLRNPDLHSATFRHNLKAFLFQQYLMH